MSTENFDVVIVGAGLSGVSAACHLRKYCPSKSFTILEGRKSMGGTWDIFRYPGVRSDSDMFTLGYSFKPWPGRKCIADGEAIRHYIKDTAAENDIDKHIQFQQSVQKASWSSDEAKWTIESTQADGSTKSVTANFIMMCSGYYNYDEGYTPDFPGRDQFEGEVIHPQFWPKDLDYRDKNVVVIGSGATAITLVPAMTDKAKHVTMLQRSPTYVASQPAEDKLANLLRAVLPEKVAYSISRWKKVAFTTMFYKLSKSRPKLVKSILLAGVRQQLGKSYDIEKHFTPKYNPWDERLCAITNADLFKSIRKGSASVVTDHIDTFTKEGIKLKSGESVDADIIVTATGLNLKVLGGLQFTVDGSIVDPAKGMNYKGMMLSDVPNIALAMGYTNASWTLKTDLTCRYVCRLLNHMDANNFDYCAPRRNDPSVKEEPFLDFDAGYVKRSIHLFPKQGSKAPWKLHQNYPLDLMALRYSSIKDNAMEFYKAGETGESLVLGLAESA